MPEKRVRLKYQPDCRFRRVDETKPGTRVVVFPVGNETKPFPAEIVEVGITPQEGNLRVKARNDKGEVVSLGGGTSVRKGW